ncbi:uncharacterized protein LOC123311371 [Coccinella septempunctata]|uniref:uncharacterized protein LOC123311371 n=2 Tax=Coccinella septempunctata TaxID=41139 RepID=UPI001D09474D|nr:uncharacterized protein LOC123311371 [Coccinella septempunctata]XP_044751217.1 uncharacterized protein LOC123311371 [Coccinella septempunctata]
MSQVLQRLPDKLTFVGIETGTLRDSANLSTSSMKPPTLPVPPNEIFHLWTGMVGTGDGRGSGSNGILSLVMVLPELTQDAGVPVCETSAAVGRLTPSPRSIRDVSALSGWIGDIPGELGTSTSKRDRSCCLDGCPRVLLLLSCSSVSKALVVVAFSCSISCNCASSEVIIKFSLP